MSDLNLTGVSNNSELASDVANLPAVIPTGVEFTTLEVVPSSVQVTETGPVELLDAAGQLLARVGNNDRIPEGRDRAFEYGTISIGDIRVESDPDPKNPNRRIVKNLLVNDEPVLASERFWGSVMANFGFAPSIFNLFSHAEVFDRIKETAKNDRLRYTIERNRNHAPKMLAVVNPAKATIDHDRLQEIIGQFGGERVTYLNGMVNSTHTPRVGGNRFLVGPDEMINKFLMEVPVDGYGKPCIYLAMERVICTNGAVARTPMFKTELNLGKGADVVSNAVIRALDTFNSDEGFAALRERLELAGRSWASVFESQVLYKLLVRLISGRHLTGGTEAEMLAAIGSREGETSSPILGKFHEMTGDVSRIWGFANPDAMSQKRQRSLPVEAKVIDLVNFATEMATHRADEHGRQQLHAWVGSLIGDKDGYDMEGSGEVWAEHADFYDAISKQARDERKQLEG